MALHGGQIITFLEALKKLNFNVSGTQISPSSCLQKRFLESLFNDKYNLNIIGGYDLVQALKFEHVRPNAHYPDQIIMLIILRKVGENADVSYGAPVAADINRISNNTQLPYPNKILLVGRLDWNTGELYMANFDIAFALVAPISKYHYFLMSFSSISMLYGNSISLDPEAFKQLLLENLEDYNTVRTIEFPSGAIDRSVACTISFC